MKLNIAVALGADSVTGPVGDEFPVALFCALIRVTPYMAKLLVKAAAARRALYFPAFRQIKIPAASGGVLKIFP
jgi:hypothetical protein